MLGYVHVEITMFECQLVLLLSLLHDEIRKRERNQHSTHILTSLCISCLYYSDNAIFIYIVGCNIM